MRRVLIHGDQVFAPEDGVGQGCPLAAARFSAALLVALRVVCERYPATVSFVAYADDVTMRADCPDTARAAVALLLAELAKLGLRVNLAKCWTAGFVMDDVPAFAPGTRLLGAFLPFLDPVSKIFLPYSKYKLIHN